MLSQVQRIHLRSETRFNRHWPMRSVGQPRKFGGCRCLACDALKAGTCTRMTSSSDPHPMRRLARTRNTPNIRGCWSSRSLTRLNSKSVTCAPSGESTNWPLVLNLFLGGKIDMPTNRGRKHWVFTRMADGTPGIGGSEWLQEGYFIPDFMVQADDFSNVSPWGPLAEVATDAYYGRRGFDGKPLTVPASMTDLSDAFSSLKGPQRNRFLRSCYWLHMGDVVWTHSQSLHLVSLINGLECLALSGEKRLVPDASTKMFLDFMQ